MSTMANTNPSQLFLLADHIKLSLLERQRAISMKIGSGTQDGHISRSLDNLQSGIQAIENQLAETPDSNLSEQLSSLRSQHDTMRSQFLGSDAQDKPPSQSPTVTSPNNPRLAADFAAAQSVPTSKSVRFQDNPSSPTTSAASRTALFSTTQQPYRDDPDEDGAIPDHSALSNEQIHAYHSQVLADQDSQLDELSTSIGRQRELSVAIGDELDDQAMLLNDVEEATDRHQGQLNRAQTRLGKVARRARENWGMTVIAILIIILVLLIMITK